MFMTVILETKPGETSAEETKVRLLHAAGQVFAEQGFERATVRDICSRAQANIAAINYHFGSKDRLYQAALMFWGEESLQKHPPLLGLGADAPAEERFNAFVHSFLRRLFDPGRPTWHGQLMAREMITPTGALDQKIMQYVRPLVDLLTGLIRELLDPETATDVRVRQVVCGVMGQCLFYLHHRPVLDRLMPDQRFCADSLEQLADHITTFSLAGMRGVSEISTKAAHE